LADALDDVAAPFTTVQALCPGVSNPHGDVINQPAPRRYVGSGSFVLPTARNWPASAGTPGFLKS
jgi:hypothetical protein